MLQDSGYQWFEYGFQPYSLDVFSAFSDGYYTFSLGIPSPQKEELQIDSLNVKLSKTQILKLKDLLSKVNLGD